LSVIKTGNVFRQVPGSIWPPGNPGPIGPPRRSGGRSGAGAELNEFYADSGLVHGDLRCVGGPDFRGGGGGGGLYGLSQPLFEYNDGTPISGHHGSLEPPYKRKFEDW
jgi:hypothetical protein